MTTCHCFMIFFGRAGAATEITSDTRYRVFVPDGTAQENAAPSGFPLQCPAAISAAIPHATLVAPTIPFRGAAPHNLVSPFPRAAIFPRTNLMLQGFRPCATAASFRTSASAKCDSAV